SRDVLARRQAVSVTFARADAVPRSRLLRAPLVSVLSVAGFLLIWFIAAEIAQSRLLPGPVAVIEYIYKESVHGDLLTELGITLWRVTASFVVAMAIGSVLGLAMGESPALNRALDPWLIVLLNLPALVIIILAYVWFGLNEAAAIGAVALNKIPNAIVTMRESARPRARRDGARLPPVVLEQAPQRDPAAASALFRRGLQIGYLIDLEDCF